MLERDFQKELKKEIELVLPGAIVLKTDPEQWMGIPDLLILYKDRWAMLEVKRNSRASKRPNQDRHVRYFDSLSFCRFISPENKEEVLDELQYALRT